MRKCSGWLRFSGQIFLKMPARLRAPTLHIDKVKRTMSADREYIAIVYEYVEEVENDPTVVEEVTAFFLACRFQSHSLPCCKKLEERSLGGSLRHRSSWQLWMASKIMWPEKGKQDTDTIAIPGAHGTLD